MGASTMNQTCPCPLGHPGMWGSPLCARYQAGPAHAQVSISWFCPVICRFQGTEPCVEMPQVCSAWTTHSDVLRGWAGSQMREGGWLWDCVNPSEASAL